MVDEIDFDFAAIGFTASDMIYMKYTLHMFGRLAVAT